MESRTMIEGYIEPNDLRLALYDHKPVRLYSSSYRDGRYKVRVPLSAVHLIESEEQASNVKIYVMLGE